MYGTAHCSAGRGETQRCIGFLADRGVTLLINSRHPADIEELPHTGGSIESVESIPVSLERWFAEASGLP